VSIDNIVRVILVLKFASSEIELKGIRVPHRFNLPENMLLLSLLPTVIDGCHREGFLQLDLITRPAETWMPQMGGWSNKKWEDVLLDITINWLPLQGVSLTVKSLKKELSAVIDELQRISSGEENIVRCPSSILVRTKVNEGSYPRAMKS
jgi:hypothetical protein